MRIIYFMVAFLLSILVLLVLTVTGTLVWPVFSMLQWENILITTGIIVDLGILLLIVYEDFGRPYFYRPKPLIRDLIISQKHPTTDRINVLGVPVTLFRSNSVELWINITNDGKSAIKRLRARAKFYPLPKAPQARNRPKPSEMSEEMWRQQVELSENFEMRMQREIAEAQFGRPLPFSRTPRGTIGLPWVEADNRVTYEVDLAPKSDEASVRLLGLYPLDEVALMDLEKTGRIKFEHPEGSPFPNARVIAVQIGNISGVVINPSGEGMLYDLALKFWIVAENISEDVSKVFHVEVPGSADSIICTEVKKGSKQYKQFERLLSV